MHDKNGREGQVLRTGELEVAGGDGPPWFDVTVANYTFLYSCLQAISHDAGYGANHETFSISARWEEKLTLIEAALAGLSDQDRLEFCIGDGDKIDEIAARSPELTLASDLFEDFAES
jgi:hypothetical protein